MPEINPGPPAPAFTLPLEFDETYGALPLFEGLGRPGSFGGTPMPGSGFAPPGTAPAPKQSRRSLKIALICAAVLLILSAIGGVMTYLLTRPKPLITVTSSYHAGGAPVASTAISLHIKGAQFSANSAITLLLDGVPAPDTQVVPSDNQGAFTTDLTVTGRWKAGKHTLTARDADGYTTEVGAVVLIVSPGEANTPGPNGAPPDDTPAFTLQVTLSITDPTTGQSIPALQENLTVQGQPDPAGGTVCNPQTDDGQPHTNDGTTSSGVQVHVIIAEVCSGSYKSGKVSYTETVTQYEEDLSNGVTCTVQTPALNQHLEGTFTSATSASGAFDTGAVTVTCSDGNSQDIPAQTGTWTATVSS